MKFFHLWQIVKPIKGFNFKSYRLLALFLVYTIYQPTVHPVPGFNFVTLTVLEESVANQNCKMYQGM